MSDAEIIDFARDQNLDSEELMDMSRRERLISEEIYLREWEDEGTPRSHVYNDEEWQYSKRMAIYGKMCFPRSLTYCKD